MQHNILFSAKVNMFPKHLIHVSHVECAMTVVFDVTISLRDCMKPIIFNGLLRSVWGEVFTVRQDFSVRLKTFIFNNELTDKLTNHEAIFCILILKLAVKCLQILSQNV